MTRLSGAVLRFARCSAPLLLVLPWLACQRSTSGLRLPRRTPVELVSIDTLRSDRLRAYGYAAGRTPSIDALAREGVVFDSVWSHCPLTLPAHASMFTGCRHPSLMDVLGCLKIARFPGRAIRERPCHPLCARRTQPAPWFESSG